jgi:short subunit dehydrogenase-like uncharacterized protein
MAERNWMIYGATGYTGTLIAEEAVRRGHRPILAGRNRAKLEPVAARLGLPLRSFELGDGPSIAAHLADVSLVFHAAGPFVDTSEPMVRACLAVRASYVDITGELPVFQRSYAFDADAKAQGVTLMSGVGFDVVPTDCMARYVAARVPGASSLELAIAGLDGVSAGTAKSMLDGALAGGSVRRAGVLMPMPFGKGARRVRFVDRERPVLPIPWGDLESAYRSTGIPDITTYMAFPESTVRSAGATWRLSAALLPLARGVVSALSLRDVLGRAIEKRVTGPSEAARAEGRSQVWARAQNEAGQHCEAWLEARDGYTFTALAGVRSVERILSEQTVGALTPAQAFGEDFVLEIEGSRRFDVLPERTDAKRASEGAVSRETHA